MAEDFYNLLGVARNASGAEIKSAYRKLAMKCHPDRNPGNKQAEEKFRKINAAYEALSDPQKRQIYDQHGEAGLAAQGAGGRPGFGGAGVDVGDLFEGIFESFFGGPGGGGRRPRRGHDVKAEAEVSLEEAYRGTQVTVSFERVEACAACDGSGARRGTGVRRCSECRGAGRVQFSQGFFSMTQACPACGGEGQVVESPCRDCSGAGRVRGRAERKIRMPAGIFDGATLRVEGWGDAAGRGAAHGDLFVAVKVRTDPRFERNEDDLVMEAVLDIAEASLGTTLDLPTISGERTRIKVPAGVQHGATFRVRDKGMPKLHGKGFGDLMVRVKIEVPTHLTERERQLLLEFAKIRGNGSQAAALGEKSEEGGLLRRLFGK